MAPLRGWAPQGQRLNAKVPHLRKRAARTFEARCAAISESLDAFTSQECANYFRNSGYAPS